MPNLMRNAGRLFIVFRISARSSRHPTNLRTPLNEVQIYDYVEGAVPMLAKMQAKRMRGFKSMGYGQIAE